MRITVLTPTYNRGGSIQKLYTSLDNQSIKDFEWLIVDDGKCSGDGYQNAVTQFTGRDEAICIGQALYEKTRPECLLWAEVISIERKRSKTCENITDF